MSSLGHAGSRRPCRNPKCDGWTSGAIHSYCKKCREELKRGLIYGHPTPRELEGRK